jgi:hypothetical protein
MHHEHVVATARHPRVLPAALWLVALAVVAAAAIVWVRTARVLSDGRPVPVANVPQPDAVAWHGRVFRSERDLAAELRREGRSYGTWSRNHPAAAALLASLGTRP